MTVTNRPVIDPIAVLMGAEVAEWCRANGIMRLSVFGSFLRGTASQDSDIDLLVEFDPGCRVSLFDVGGMVMDLRERLGRDVDLRTAQDLSPLFRDRVIQEAKVLYAA